MESLTRSQEREMKDLYDEIFIHGTSYKSLLNDGFTIEEINYVLVKDGLKPITIRAKEKLAWAYKIKFIIKFKIALK